MSPVFSQIRKEKGTAPHTMEIRAITTYTIKYFRDSSVAPSIVESQMLFGV